MFSLQFPRKLYGRAKETAVLRNAFARVCSGQSGLWLVHGDAGTGKTVLIQETLGPLVAEKGYFISGKSDQLQRNIPYVPFIQALGNLMRQFLTESPERLAAWKRKLLQAVERNGAVITALIPEVELIIGRQPPMEVLEPGEAQNRFCLVFRNFICAVARQAHPLIIFLDDLQWADPASLALIWNLSKDTDRRCLMLIGAYRDNEVTDTHPLRMVLEELPKAGLPVQHVPLAPLNADDTNQFIAHTLQCVQEHAQPLAGILFRKTGGNPFFLGQLLQSLSQEGLLCYNLPDARWEWDMAAIQAMPMSDDVFQLLLGKLQKLPEGTRHILQLAACIGNRFCLQTLAIACEQTVAQAVDNLRPALREGLILPVKDLTEAAEQYEFLHDRVQQAAYALVATEEQKQQAHLRIGRLLLQNAEQGKLADQIMGIMDHLNRSPAFIKDPSERIKLAAYNLLAGRQAKASIAYGTALTYFQAGLALLPEQAWVDYYRLTYGLHMERSLCECLCAHGDLAEQLCDLLLSQARTDMEKVDIYVNKLVFNADRERYRKNLQLGRQGLKLLGINLPLKPGKCTVIWGILRTVWRLRNCKSADLTGLPDMTPVQKKAVTLLLAQVGAAAMTNPALLTLVMTRISSLSLNCNNAQYASMGYACYSFITGSVLGDYRRGHRLAQVALALLEKHDNNSAKGIAFSLLGSLVSHWTVHGKTGLNHLQQAVDYGRKAGRVLVVGDALAMLIENKLILGFPLQELYRECRHYYNLTKRVSLLNYQLLIANLIEAAADGADDFTKQVTGEPATLTVYHISKLQLYYHTGHYTHALASAEQARSQIPTIRGHLLSAAYIFYYSLAITAAYGELPVKQQRRYRKVLKMNLRQMRKWASACPENFLHKCQLLEAETARLDGRDSEAMTLYDQAMQAARAQGYLQNEAIAGELAAMFHLHKGRDKMAQVYLTDACHGYARWGLAAKVRQLKNRYAHLLGGISVEKTQPEMKVNKPRPRAPEDSGSPGDPELYALRKVMRKLAEETDPEVLLHSFLQIAMENAGADKGYLILEKDEKLLIEAAQEGHIHHAATATPLPLEKSVHLSRSMGRYVARTLEPVVVNDPEQAGIFARDPYIAVARAKSFVCLPLLFRKIPLGVLYLENSRLTGAFTPERMTGLQFLSRQIAYIQKLQIYLTEENCVKGEAPPALIEPLTEREREVLSLIAGGMSNPEIARRLQLTLNTVKSHIWHIYGKLQVNRRVQAVTRARELKLLENE